MKMNGSDVAVLLLVARRGGPNRPSRALSPGADDACWSLPVHAGALVAGDSKQQSRLLNAFELVHAAIFEAKAGAGDEVAHGRRYEDLAQTSECRNPRSCVHCYPAHCLADPLDFTRVNPGSEFEPELDRSRLERLRTVDCTAGPVEGGEETVTCAVDFDPAIVRKLALGVRVHARQQCAPLRVPKCRDPSG